MSTTAPTATSRVLEHPPLAPADAAAHFAEALRRYADASDVHADLQQGVTAILVVDARAPERYARGHIPGAINVPHRTIGPETRALLPRDTVIVTYCDGIGCNGSTKAALKLARLGYQVKELIGGIAFWEYEGFPVESSSEAAAKKDKQKETACAVAAGSAACGC